MPKLALFNLAFGFWLLFLAAAAGAFIATDLTAAYVKDRVFLDSWAMMMAKSSHGHTNLFGLIHIAFGLTMPYSTLSHRIKMAQTFGLALGSCAMAVGLLVRAQHVPSQDNDLIGVIIGVGLSSALAAMFCHAAGLSAKFLKKPF